jgi:hypothetical protein
MIYSSSFTKIRLLLIIYNTMILEIAMRSPTRRKGKMLLKCFLCYIAVRHTEGNLNGDDWDQITQMEFDAYNTSPKYYLPQAAKFSPQTNLHLLPDQVAHTSIILLNYFVAGLSEMLLCSLP